MITKFYKNSVSFRDLLEQPMNFLHTLYYLAVKESRTDAGRAGQQNEEIAEAMGE